MPELDKEERRDALAAMTFGYTPVMIEHLFDEALVWALRDGRDAMDWHDVQQAKMTEEIGLKQPVEYTEDEKLHDRDPRGGPRGRRVPRRPEPQARGALDHQAPRRARLARALRQRGALHRAPAPSSSGSMKIAFGGMIGRGAVLRRVGHRSGRATSRTRPASRRRWSARSAWPARWSRSRRSRPVRSRRASSARCSPTKTRAAPVEQLLDQAKADVQSLLDNNRHLVVALRDELLATEELVGDEIIDCLHEAEERHRLGTAAKA